MDQNWPPFQESTGPLETDKEPQSAMVTETSDSEASENSGRLDPKLCAFDAFYKIGSDLKHTLKAFENNNHYLTNKQSKLQQELATLKKKRDLQKSTLIELQIKSEKLDQRKQRTLEEFTREKRDNLEILNQGFQEVSDKNQCLSETHEKIQQLLSYDQKNVFNAFLSEISHEYELQIKASKDYEQAKKKSFFDCCEKIKSAIAEEENLDFELDEAVQKCKNHAGLKEKFEYELQEKFSNMKLIENEAEALKIKIHECNKTLEEMSRENAKLSEELTKTVQVNSVELRKIYENIERVKQEIEEKVLDLNEKEVKLNEATEEHKFLAAQVRSAEKQVEGVVADINDLEAQIGEMNKNVEVGMLAVKELEGSIFSMSGLHQLEKDVSSRKNVLLEKVTANTVVVTDIDKKLACLEEKWASTKSKLENTRVSDGEMRHRNESAKKELENMLNGLKEVRESTKLKKMESDLNDLKAKSATLREQIREAEEKLESAAKEISRLEMENAALDKEFLEVNEWDSRAAEKIAHLNEERKKVQVLKTQIAEVRENVKSIRASKELSISIELLREQVKKIEQEIEYKNKDQESQQEAIETSFEKTMRNVLEQMDQLKEVSEEEITRRQLTIDRFRNSNPRLQLEVEERQREIVLATQSNIEKMKGRLQMIDQLIEHYKVLMARSQTSESRSNFSVMRMLGTIEEHLASSFRGMTEYLQMEQEDMSSPSYLMFKRTLNAFTERFATLVPPDNVRLSDKAYLDELKNAALCLFGLQRYSETVAGSESTFCSPSSSKFHDF